MNSFPDATHTSFLISLDGGRPEEVFVGNTAFTGGSAAVKLGKAAAAIQEAVRAIKPIPAFNGFTCAVSGSQLVLSSGTRGGGSAVSVLAGRRQQHRRRVPPAVRRTAAAGQNVYLIEGGGEAPSPKARRTHCTSAARPNAKGIFALEGVQAFNLLCLPGISDAGILADAAAYCSARRAFMIVDPPADVDNPDEMLTEIEGTDLPKTNDAAVYFPWIKIADPLKGGKLRLSAPSGTIAGLYARTDCAARRVESPRRHRGHPRRRPGPGLRPHRLRKRHAQPGRRQLPARPARLRRGGLGSAHPARR